jgi:hypothetical protein
VGLARQRRSPASPRISALCQPLDEREVLNDQPCRDPRFLNPGGQSLSLKVIS